MSSSNHKNWAAESILDPLIEPTPAEETGLGSSFRPVNSPATTPPGQQGRVSSASRHSTGASTSTNPFRRSSPQSSAKPSTPNGKSPSTTNTRARNSSNGSSSSFPAYSPEPTRRSAEQPRGSPPTPTSNSTRPRRTSSLRERFPGDNSHRPLATLTHDNKQANRSPHLRKKHLPGADLVDKLDDTVLSSYHHEGPYDAASLARNNSYQSSPVAALHDSNAEALKATPKEKVQDSLRMHRPLDGVAIVPPGQPDRLGRVYQYKEGANLMIEDGGNYKRWPGLDYHPDDIKGKGEPSYSIEKTLKEHNASAQKHGRRASQGAADYADIELVERPRRTQNAGSMDDDGIAAASGAQQTHRELEGGRRRSGSGAGARISGEFKRRFGSLRRREGRVADTGAGAH